MQKTHAGEQSSDGGIYLAIPLTQRSCLRVLSVVSIEWTIISCTA